MCPFVPSCDKFPMKEDFQFALCLTWFTSTFLVHIWHYTPLFWATQAQSGRIVILIRKSRKFKHLFSQSSITFAISFLPQMLSQDWYVVICSAAVTACDLVTRCIFHQRSLGPAQKISMTSVRDKYLSIYLSIYLKVGLHSCLSLLVHELVLLGFAPSCPIVSPSVCCTPAVPQGEKKSKKTKQPWLSI